MTDTDRLEQIRLLETALAERNAELQRVRDQRDALRVDLQVMTQEHCAACQDRDLMIRERDQARREVCRWAFKMPQLQRKLATDRGWDCFKEDGK